MPVHSLSNPSARHASVHDWQARQLRSDINSTYKTNHNVHFTLYLERPFEKCAARDEKYTIKSFEKITTTASGCMTKPIQCDRTENAAACKLELRCSDPYLRLCLRRWHRGSCSRPWPTSRRLLFKYQTSSTQIARKTR